MSRAAELALRIAIGGFGNWCFGSCPNARVAIPGNASATTTAHPTKQQACRGPSRLPPWLRRRARRAGALNVRNRRAPIQFSHAFPGAKPTLGKTGISTQVRKTIIDPLLTEGIAEIKAAACRAIGREISDEEIIKASLIAKEQEGLATRTYTTNCAVHWAPTEEFFHQCDNELS